MSTTRQYDRLTVLRLAAAADIDPRSALRALDEGPRALRGRAGEKAEAAMRAMGLMAPAGAAHAP